jgi:hypothetical protein
MEGRSETERVIVWFCPLHEVAGTTNFDHNETCNTIDIGWFEYDPEQNGI